MATIIRRLAAIAAALTLTVAAWATDYIQVTGTHVRLRLSPSLQGKIFTDPYGNPVYPDKGAILECIGQAGDFYCVNINGYRLYISKKHTRHLGSYPSGGTTSGTPSAVIVTGTNVRLRTGASLNSPTLQDANGNNIHPAKGERLRCTGQKGDFYRVVYNGLTVYISKQYSRPAR